MEDPVYLRDEQVLSRMLSSESRQEIQSYFANKTQVHFDEKDRRELAKWMRDVCHAEECQPDVFPLSIMIVDRFLSRVRTKRTQLQLLGTVCLLLASKLRQTSQIPARYLIYYTQDLVSLQELKTWEMFVLSTLKWDLALITPVDYVDILSRRSKLSEEEEEETYRLIAESCLDFHDSLRPPSMIAWSCMMQATSTAPKAPVTPQTTPYSSNWTLDEGFVELPAGYERLAEPFTFMASGPNEEELESQMQQENSSSRSLATPSPSFDELYFAYDNGQLNHSHNQNNKQQHRRQQQHCSRRMRRMFNFFSVTTTSD